MLEDCQVSRLDAIQLPLVNKFYKACGDSARAGRGDIVYVVRNGSAIVAAVRLQGRAPDSYFLRSMCVAPEFRRKGIGHLLLNGLTSFLDTVHCYCYPFSHLEHFYRLAGFEVVDCESQPSYMRDPLVRYRQQGRKLLLMVRQPQ